MHKRRTQSMQRYHRVHEIDVQPSGYRTQDDLLPHLDHMPLADCTAERARLIHEKLRAEQDLVSAKRGRDSRTVEAIGLRIQGLCSRLSQINTRLKQLRGNAEYEALKQAMTEELDEWTWRRVLDRKDEIRRAAPAGDAI